MEKYGLNQLREMFLSFFETKGHLRLPSFSLVPQNDKSVNVDVPTTAEGAYRYWEQRVNRLRNVIRKRPTKLWEFTQEAFNLTDDQMVRFFGPKPEMPANAI